MMPTLFAGLCQMSKMSRAQRVLKRVQMRFGMEFAGFLSDVAETFFQTLSTRRNKTQTEREPFF